MEAMVKGVETDLRKVLDAYIQADVKDDELSISIVSNGSGWRMFLDGLEEKRNAGLDRQLLSNFVLSKYCEYCFEDLIRT